MRLSLSPRLPQLRALPQRVIDVLHRQRRPAGSLTGTPAGIGHPQIPHQRGDRPAIGGDMVHHRHQHVLVVADAEKPRPQRDLDGQVKRATRRGAHGLFQPVGRPAAGINDMPPEVGPLHGHHQLLGDPLGRREQRAQALLAAHHIGQRRPQRLGIQAPAQPQRHRHVVNR